MNELIKLIQEPVIEEHLRALKEQIDRRVVDALALVCTEDTVKSVKATRAELNKEFQALEDQRKFIKKAVLGPYDQFEAIYRECVSDAYKRADAELKNRIDSVQAELLARKKAEVEAYFLEYAASRGVDWLEFSSVGLNVTLSTSTKKLKGEAKAEVDRVAQSVALLSGMENADEIMVEYKLTLNATAAIATVEERHKRLDAERESRAERDTRMAEQAEAARKVEAFSPAKAQESPELLTTTFTVTDTLERLRLLKKFLISNGYQYK